MPEVWIALAGAFDVPQLRLTTRDIDDYDELMSRRLEAVAQHGITMSGIADVVGKLEPLDGAKAFMAHLRREAQVIILSDTFLQFWDAMAPQLDYPTVFCNTLVVENDRIVGYRMRIDDGKRRSVEAFRDLGFRTTAAGDSFNDISMLRAADRGILYRPSPQVISANADLVVAQTYDELLDQILSAPHAPHPAYPPH